MALRGRVIAAAHSEGKGYINAAGVRSTVPSQRRVSLQLTQAGARDKDSGAEAARRRPRASVDSERESVLTALVESEDYRPLEELTTLCQVLP